MFELFHLGFIPVTLFDLIDIAAVTILFYWIYKALKDTIAMQVLFGLIFIVALSFLVEAINLRSINLILRILSDVWILAFIIIFQPELRKMLMEWTQAPIFKIFRYKTEKYSLDEIVDTAVILSRSYTGALMVFPKTQSVAMSSIDAGIPINAKVSKELLLAIFNTKSPLHDGAIIINKKMQIETARCILPLSATRQQGNRLLGTRHRAGLGLSEKIDAVVLIVSEETGSISIAYLGQLEIGIPHNVLKEKLEEKLNL